MTLASMFLFLLAYATAVAVPGPGLAALIARVLARGAGGVAPFIAGFIVGDLVWFAIAAAGMAALAETLGSFFTFGPSGRRGLPSLHRLQAVHRPARARRSECASLRQRPEAGGPSHRAWLWRSAIRR
jgi:hypothetical protein